jgi:peptide deformylase
MITAPDSSLRKIAKPVDVQTDDVYGFLRVMRAEIIKYNGAGIAAPQVGIDRQLAIISPPERPWYVMINPELLHSSAEVVSGLEGCLSVPGETVKVVRAQEITVRFTDLSGRVVTRLAEGFEARIVQHEIDHLQGKLIIDHMSNVVRLMYHHKRKR